MTFYDWISKGNLTLKTKHLKHCIGTIGFGLVFERSVEHLKILLSCSWTCLDAEKSKTDYALQYYCINWTVQRSLITLHTHTHTIDLGKHPLTSSFNPSPPPHTTQILRWYSQWAYYVVQDFSVFKTNLCWRVMLGYDVWKENRVKVFVAHLVSMDAHSWLNTGNF